MKREEGGAPTHLIWSLSLLTWLSQLHGEVEFIFLAFLMETEAWTVTQVGLELEAVLLPPPPQCWNCRSELPHPATILLLD